MAVRVIGSLPRPGNVAFDVDGCLVLGGRAVPGAAAAIGAAHDAGLTTLVVTNNSTRHPEAVAAMLGATLGIDLHSDRVLTSSMAAATMLRPADAPVLVVGEEGIHTVLATHGLAITDDPDAARTVVVGLARGFDYALLRAAARAVSRGARLVATNDDATFPEPEGTAPGAGAIVAAIVAASGGTPLVAGKPHPPMVGLMRRRLRPGPTWVVGDRAETDVAFARAGGWWSVLVLTGITGDHRALPDALRPDAVIDSVADLATLLDHAR